MLPDDVPVFERNVVPEFVRVVVELPGVRVVVVVVPLFRDEVVLVPEPVDVDGRVTFLLEELLLLLPLPLTPPPVEERCTEEGLTTVPPFDEEVLHLLFLVLFVLLDPFGPFGRCGPTLFGLEGV